MPLTTRRCVSCGAKIAPVNVLVTDQRIIILDGLFNQQVPAFDMIADMRKVCAITREAPQSNRMRAVA
ncbi:hypothetical protein [Rhodanobacter sp. C05]|uniref:hypothetical protein n=1 Tax=Rhodanobacter sp. C05 TaxID=1945855 RepID=UPI00117A886E|nr:hypothetical protein [Rhodanobacter sp. C05]